MRTTGYSQILGAAYDLPTGVAATRRAHNQISHAEAEIIKVSCVEGSEDFGKGVCPGSFLSGGCTSEGFFQGVYVLILLLERNGKLTM